MEFYSKQDHNSCIRKVPYKFRTFQASGRVRRPQRFSSATVTLTFILATGVRSLKNSHFPIDFGRDQKVGVGLGEPVGVVWRVALHHIPLRILLSSDGGGGETLRSSDAPAIPECGKSERNYSCMVLFAVELHTCQSCVKKKCYESELSFFSSTFWSVTRF